MRTIARTLLLMPLGLSLILGGCSILNPKTQTAATKAAAPAPTAREIAHDQGTAHAATPEVRAFGTRPGHVVKDAATDAVVHTHPHAGTDWINANPYAAAGAVSGYTHAVTRREGLQ